MSFSTKKTGISQERKERIMDAALGLFAELGFHGVAVPKIAKDAGVATGSLYNYFDSKEELVNELYWFWKQKLKVSYLGDYPAHATVEKQFRFIWQRLYDFASSFPKAFRFIESHLHASYLLPRCLELEDELFEIGRQFVRTGQAEGVLRPAPPQIIVSMFFGAFVQFFEDSQAGRIEWNCSNSLVLRDLCWRAMT